MFVVEVASKNTREPRSLDNISGMITERPERVAIPLENWTGELIFKIMKNKKGWTSFYKHEREAWSEYINKQKYEKSTINSDITVHVSGSLHTEIMSYILQGAT